MGREADLASHGALGDLSTIGGCGFADFGSRSGKSLVDSGELPSLARRNATRSSLGRRRAAGWENGWPPGQTVRSGGSICAVANRRRAVGLSPQPIHVLEANVALTGHDCLGCSQARRLPSQARAYDNTRPIVGVLELATIRRGLTGSGRAVLALLAVAVLMLVYLFNLCFLGLLIAAFFNPVLWFYLFGFWVGKTLVELPFMISAAVFFHQKKMLRYFFLFQPLHIMYTVISGLFGQFGTYEWKGRRVK